jgi:zinc/manganese transport system ATP-binding protein
MLGRPVTASLPYLTDAVSLASVTAGYGGRAVLNDVSLRIRRGEFVGVVGPSGSGKTSLLRVLTGQIDLHHGAVDVLGTAVTGRQAPPGLGYVPQVDAVDPEFPLTVEQVVLFGDAASSGRLPWFSRDERRRAHEVLERLGLGDLARRRIGELSGGQRQRAFLARALARRCELLVLDEPTSGVDLATSRDVLQVLFQLHADGITVLLSTHDLNFVAAHLPRIACLAPGRGELVADGPPDQVLTPSVLEQTYGTPMRVIRDGGRIVVVDDAPASTLGEVAS